MDLDWCVTWLKPNVHISNLIYSRPISTATYVIVCWTMLEQQRGPVICRRSLSNCTPVCFEPWPNRRWPEHGEDVSRAGRVLAAVEPSAELTHGLQQIQVVAPHKVLSQADDGHHQRDLRHITPTSATVETSMAQRSQKLLWFRMAIQACLFKRKCLTISDNSNRSEVCWCWPLRGDRQTSLPPSRPAGLPSPPACRSSWCSWTAPSSGPA